MGTLILALLFSAYILRSISVTKLSDNEAKDIYSFTHKGKFAGMNCYIQLDNGEVVNAAGSNMLNDDIIMALISALLAFGVEPKFDNVEVL